MATTKLKIRNDLVKKAKSESSETTIYVQYTHNRKIKLFNTGKKIDPDFWDDKNGCVKRSYKGFTSLNAVISDKKKQIEEIVNKAQFNNIEPTLEYVEEQFNALAAPGLPDVNKDFFKLFEHFIQEHSIGKTLGTVKQYRNTYNHLKAFQREKRYKLTLESIDLNFYTKFSSYLLVNKQFGNNSIAKAIKILKVFLNYLTSRGMNDNLTFKHKDFKKPKAETDIIYLSQGELQHLITFDLSKNFRLDRVRDLFVFECATGIRFSDMANLKPENIKEDHIDFTTIKTKDRLIIPLTPYAKAIVNKYEGKLPKAMSNQKMNDYLKELGEVCGINEPVHRALFKGGKRIEITVPKYELITTHTARRTFITQSLERGLRPEIIMNITGHKDIKTMMRYVKITGDVVKNEMMRAWNDSPTQFKVG